MRQKAINTKLTIVACLALSSCGDFQRDAGQYINASALSFDIKSTPQAKYGLGVSNPPTFEIDLVFHADTGEVVARYPVRVILWNFISVHYAYRMNPLINFYKTKNKRVSDLIGGYTGGHFGVDALVGGGTYELINKRKVRLNIKGFYDRGIGVEMGGSYALVTENTGGENLSWDLLIPF